MVYKLFCYLILHAFLVRLICVVGIINYYHFHQLQLYTVNLPTNSYQFYFGCIIPSVNHIQQSPNLIVLLLNPRGQINCAWSIKSSNLQINCAWSIKSSFKVPSLIASGLHAIEVPVLQGLIIYLAD